MLSWLKRKKPVTLQFATINGQPMILTEGQLTADKVVRLREFMALFPINTRQKYRAATRMLDDGGFVGWSSGFEAGEA